MFVLPCSTEDCTGDAAPGQPVCDVCHDRNGYPAGYSRAKDEAWLNYRPCSEIRAIPVNGPGCNAHPVTPRPDVCSECPAVAA
jgi:hypothetical protein